MISIILQKLRGGACFCDLIQCGGVPEAQLSGGGFDSQPSAVRREGKVLQQLAFGQCQQDSTGSHVPELEGAIQAGTGQGAAIRGESESPRVVEVSQKSADRFG